MFINFKDYLFEEVRLQDILSTNNDYINSFKKDFDSSTNFINFIQLNNERCKIEYNHDLNHDLKKRIKERTNLKSIREFNVLLTKGLKFLFNNNMYDSDIKSYGLIFKEYNFSLIVHIKTNYIKIATLLSGSDITVGKKINLECTL